MAEKSSHGKVFNIAGNHTFYTVVDANTPRSKLMEEQLVFNIVRK
jgi:hypothetical protein